MVLNGEAPVFQTAQPHADVVFHCVRLGMGVCFARLAFLSTAVPRRGILPDPEQQPSPKLSRLALSVGVSYAGSARSTEGCHRDTKLSGQENHHDYRSLGFVP
jgi:hypothetical protein